MRDKNKSLINETKICVIRRLENTNLLSIDLERFYNPISKELFVLQKLFDDPEIFCNGLIDYILANRTLRSYLLEESYDFCENLNGTYQGLIPFTKADILRYSNSDRQQDSLKDELIYLCERRIVALLLEATYNRLDKDNSVVAYSHRRCGWNSDKHKFSSEFGVTFDTNFGYGTSSYFLLYVQYQDIDIIPFSDWIRYRFADYKEIKRYTQKYPLKNESWYDAMEYVWDAFNLSQTDSTAFVSRYLIGECEQMAVGLENLLEHNSFSLLDNHIYTMHTSADYIFKGHELVEFRGEKISGALSFIEDIIKLEAVGTIKRFIDRIERCNQTIQPLLVNEISLIESELEPLFAEMNIIKPQFDSLYSKYGEYAEVRQTLQQSLIEELGDAYQNIYISKEDFDKILPGGRPFEDIFLEKHPEYPEILSALRKVEKPYSELKNMISQLQGALKNIQKYNKVITGYFDK